ncbi:MAG: hypothetical protein ACK4MF_02160 [Hyphomicrobiaceae bacterium]
MIGSSEAVDAPDDSIAVLARLSTPTRMGPSLMRRADLRRGARRRPSDRRRSPSSFKRDAHETHVTMATSMNVVAIAKMRACGRVGSIGRKPDGRRRISGMHLTIGQYRGFIDGQSAKRL